MRKIVAALLLALFASPAIAQPCSPVPALPDLERRTQYAITASRGPLNVGFAIYGDSTDFVDWIQVFVNGTVTTAYTLASTSGSLATLCRPVTDAQITFSAAQTGTVQIVGARRPRRTSQFTENRGVAARDINQVISDLVAQNRETWDWRNRVIQGVPGDNFGFLSPASVRANTLFGFDGNGNLTYLPLGPTISATAGSTFNTRGLAAATSISGTVQFIQTAGFGTTGDGGDALYVRAGGSTPGGFQSADGSWWALAGSEAWPAQFGTACNGVTDDTAALQAAFAYAQSQHKTLRLRGCALDYRITAALPITDAISVVGDYYSDTDFNVTGGSSILVDADTDAIQITTDSPVHLSKFRIKYATSRPGRSCIRVDASVLSNFNSVLEDLDLLSCDTGVLMVKPANLSMNRLRLTGIGTSGINLSNSSSCDIGGVTLTNSRIAVLNGASVIRHASSSNFRATNNSFSNGDRGYQMSLTNGCVIGDIFIDHNSFEGHVIAGLDLGRAGATGSVQIVTITNNEIAAQNGPSTIGLHIPTDASGQWISKVNIEGNIFLYTLAGVSIDSITTVNVANNIFINPGAGAVALAVASNVARCTVGPNTYDYASGGIAPSIAAVCKQTNAVYTGTTALVSATAYGSMFSGDAAITFPAAFVTAPICVASPLLANTMVSAGATASPSTTGFTLRGIFLSNAQTSSAQWRCEGY